MGWPGGSLGVPFPELAGEDSRREEFGEHRLGGGEKQTMGLLNIKRERFETEKMFSREVL